MNKFLLLFGKILIAVSIVLFVADLLPIDLFTVSNEAVYLKSESADFFSINHYKLHILIAGVTAYLLSKFTDRLKR